MTKEEFEAKIKTGAMIAMKDIPEDTEITPAILNMLIEQNVKQGNEAALAEFKKAMAATERKEIFPGIEDTFGTGVAESYGKSVIDTRFFHKNYIRGGSSKDDGIMLGRQLKSGNGPFIQLSPEMETFAKMIKCQFDPTKMAMQKIDVKEYNSAVALQYKSSGMNETVSADGGALVPVEYYATIIEFAIAQSRILPKVFRIPMASNSLKVPKLTQAAGSYFGGVTLYWKSEGELKPGTVPAFEQLSFSAHKLIGLVYLTDELIEDSLLNIVNYVTGLFASAFQYETERVILNGDGTTQPLGIRNDPTINIVARAQENTIGFADLLNMDASIDENFANLDWVSRKATFAALRNLRDNNQAPIFTADYNTQVGQPLVPASMLGYPVNTTRNVPTIGNLGDIILGDFRHYIWTPRQELRIESSNAPRFIYDETTVRFVARMDGKPGVSCAFAILDEMRS